MKPLKIVTMLFLSGTAACTIESVNRAELNSDDAVDLSRSSVSESPKRAPSFELVAERGQLVMRRSECPMQDTLGCAESESNGGDLAGVTLDIAGDRGRVVRLRIAEVEIDPMDPERETHLYSVLFHDPSDSQWKNYCLPDRDNVAKAIPLSGHWDQTGAFVDSGRITFACTNGVIGKCVRWGYKPWKTVDGKSLKDYHQACTRMARADYCGNGTPHTRNGTAIDVYDVLGIQQPANGDNTVFEAAWGPDGAAYIQRARWYETLSEIEAECPDKLRDRIHRGGDSVAAEHARERAPQAILFNSSNVRIAEPRE